jgi:hypothetical protein
MRCHSRDDGRGSREAGTVTAEFAVVLPAVVLVLACALAAIGLGAQQLRLQGAAFDAARLLGRGDPGALDRVHSVDPSARLGTRSSGAVICADVTAPVSIGVLAGLELEASACALHDS